MRRHVLLLLIVSFFTFFVGLGRGAIGDSDEAFYAEAAREMVESGDWLTPYYNYETRFQKPILYYWLAAAAFEVSGPDEIAARVPSALSGLVLVLASWAFGRRWCGPKVGWLAGLITATNYGYFAMARLALPDLPLAALMTLTTWAALEATRGFGETPSAPSAPRWLHAAAIAAGLGFLMKGPVALALPLLVVLLATWAGTLGGRRLLPCPVRALVLPAVLFLAVAVPWFAGMTLEHGVAYLSRFFVAENVERFATDRYNEPRSLLFYVPIVFGGLAPWSPFLLLWVASGIRAIRHRGATIAPTGRVLLLWAAVPLLFYSLSIGKQPRYILPTLPPLAILLADSLVRRLAAREQPRAVAWLGTSAGLLLVTFGALLLRAIPLLVALQPSTMQVAAVLIIAGGVAVAVASWLRPQWLTTVLAGAAMITLLSLHFAVFSARGTDPVERMAVATLAARTGQEPVGTHRVFVRNLVFYTTVKQTDLTDFDDLAAFLSRPDPVLCVVREQELARLRTERGLSPRILFSLRYFNTAAVRLDTLLWPNPQRNLSVVHLVTNRPS